VERFVVTFGLGNGALVLEMFLFSFGDLPLTRWVLVMPWILVGTIQLYRWWRRSGPPFLSRLSDSIKEVGFHQGSNRGWAWWEPFLVLALVLAVLDLLVSSLTAPFLDGDAIYFWTPKAKIFYHHRSTPYLAFDDLHRFPHPDYPLFLPLTEVWLFLWMGRVNEYLMKLLFPIYTGLLVLGLWAFVGRLFGQRAGWIAAGLLATTPFVLQQGAEGYADLMLAFYYWIGSALLLGWLQTPEPSYLRLGAVFLGCMGWIKNEGLVLILLSGCALACYLLCQKQSRGREILRPVFLFGGIAGGMVLPWLSARYSLGLETDLSVPPIAALPSLAIKRLWPIAKTLSSELFAASSVSTKWNLSWYLLVLVSLLRGRALWRSPLRYPVLLIGGTVFVYVFIYAITPYDVTWHLGTSLDRLILHVYPLALCTIGWGLAGITSGSAPGGKPACGQHG
jgi:hypothetical protein